MSSFQAGGTKLERFLPKNQHTQRKLLNFENWGSGEVSKIRSHFRNKSRSILKLSKNFNNKKCATKLIFFNKKKLRKIRIIFGIENWLWKSRGWVILHFLTARHYVDSQNNSFEYVDFSKSLANLASLSWKLDNPNCHGIPNYLNKRAFSRVPI